MKIDRCRFWESSELYSTFDFVPSASLRLEPADKISQFDHRSDNSQYRPYYIKNFDLGLYLSITWPDVSMQR